MKNLRDDPSRVVILGAASGGLSMLELLLQESLVDVVAVVDRNPGAPGLALAAELGIPLFADVEEALLASAPCVAFNLTDNEMVEAVASDILGAGGVIGGLEARLIWQIVSDLRKTKDELEFQASHDELTGLYNRRYLLNMMAQELQRAMRYKLPFSLVLIDLDHFKNINDRHGHAAGDEVLKHVAQHLKKSVRTTDVIGRWGGEEFLVLLPHSTMNDALQAVKQWLEIVRRSLIPIPSGESVQISFSAGVATFKQEDQSSAVHESIDRLLARADERLYAAKDSGRGCVVDAAV